MKPKPSKLVRIPQPDGTHDVVEIDARGRQYLVVKADKKIPRRRLK